MNCYEHPIYGRPHRCCIYESVIRHIPHNRDEEGFVCEDANEDYIYRWYIQILKGEKDFLELAEHHPSPCELCGVLYRQYVSGARCDSCYCGYCYDCSFLGADNVSYVCPRCGNENDPDEPPT